MRVILYVPRSGAAVELSNIQGGESIFHTHRKLSSSSQTPSKRMHVEGMHRSEKQAEGSGEGGEHRSEVRQRKIESRA